METAGTNLVLVQSFEYDNGSYGDGNLTKATQHPGGGADDRVTLTYFDWRNRPVATKAVVQDDESLSLDTGRLITYRVYDNLNHVIERRTYDGDDESITITDGVPEAPGDELMRTKTAADFDERGRVYRSYVYDVDPVTGYDAGLRSSPIPGTIVAACRSRFSSPVVW